MVRYLFNHFLVNGVQMAGPSIALVAEGPLEVVAAYTADIPPQDTLVATLRGVSIYLSATLGDYYVIGTDLPEPPRFPTIDEAIDWVIATIKENWAPIAIGAAAGAVFLYWFFTRKG